MAHILFFLYKIPRKLFRPVTKLPKLPKICSIFGRGKPSTEIHKTSSVAAGQTCERTTSWGHTGGRSHRIIAPSFCDAFALIFLERKIQPSFSFVDREVEFCVPTN